MMVYELVHKRCLKITGKDNSNLEQNFTLTCLLFIYMNDLKKTVKQSLFE